jgi:hypothetical protein
MVRLSAPRLRTVVANATFTLSESPHWGFHPRAPLGPSTPLRDHGELTARTVVLLTLNRLAASGMITFICSPLSRLTPTYRAIRV